MRPGWGQGEAGRAVDERGLEGRDKTGLSVLGTGKSVMLALRGSRHGSGLPELIRTALSRP